MFVAIRLHVSLTTMHVYHVLSIHQLHPDFQVFIELTSQPFSESTQHLPLLEALKINIVLNEMRFRLAPVVDCFAVFAPF